MNSISPAALRACRSLERVNRLLRERESEGDLNPAQWAALRCLASANRFSRSPSAVAAWIATTRGTASQTIMALERKGLASRAADPRDKRGCILELTEKGRTALENDPVATVASVLAGLQPLHLVALGQGLARLLDELLAEGTRPAFQPCHGCAYFDRDADAGGHCRRFDVMLDAEEAARLCVAYEKA